MFDNLDDPKTQLLMMMGLGLLGGAPGKNKNFGADLAHGGLLGLQGYGQAKTMQSRLAEQKQAQEMRDMQMAELKRSQADREGLRGAFQASMIPGQTTQPDPYEFDGMRDGSMPKPFTKPGGFDTQGFLSRAAPFMDPMQAVQFQQQIANANKPDLMVLPEGATAIDKRNPNAGPIATGAPKLPPGMRMGANGPEYIPAYIAGQKEVRAAGAPNTVVKLPPLEGREQGDKGALNVKNVGEIQTLANAARKENAILTGIEKIPLETGKLTPLNSTVAAWAISMGATPKGLKDIAAGGQAFSAWSKELVLQKQLAQKGPQTESDARRLEQTVANPANEKEANAVIIAFSKAQNKRIIDQEKFYNDWWKKNKTYEGADDAWINGKGAVSLWDEPELKKFQAGGGTLRFDSQGNPR